jgi:hypothetical protein
MKFKKYKIKPEFIVDEAIQYKGDEDTAMALNKEYAWPLDLRANEAGQWHWIVHVRQYDNSYAPLNFSNWLIRDDEGRFRVMPHHEFVELYDEVTEEEFKELSPLEAAHKTVSALHELGIVSDEFMHEFSEICKEEKSGE